MWCKINVRRSKKNWNFSKIFRFSNFGILRQIQKDSKQSDAILSDGKNAKKFENIEGSWIKYFSEGRDN